MPAKRSSRSWRPSPPPTRSGTHYAFPSRPAEHGAVRDSIPPTPAVEPIQPRLIEPEQIRIEGPDAVEISDLVRLTIQLPEPLDAQWQTQWTILNDDSLKPSRAETHTAEFLVPDTDHDELIVAANLLFPNGHHHQLTKRVTVTGTNLPSLIRSFQQVVGQGQFSPRLTKRLADRLFKARQALAQGDTERLTQHLHSFARDCALILKRKKSVPVSTLYHRARWLERQARKRL